MDLFDAYTSGKYKNEELFGAESAPQRDSFDEYADSLNPSRGIPGDILSGAARGVFVNFPEQLGWAIKGFAPDLGKSLIEGSEALSKKYNILKPSQEETESILRRAIPGGISSMPSSWAIPAAGAAIGSVVPVIGTAAGGIAGLGVNLAMFFSAEYNRFMDEATKQGVSEDNVRPSALFSALGQSGGELLSDVVGVISFGVGKPLAKGAIGETVRAILKTPWKELAKAGGKTLAAEVSTEAGQDAFSAYLREKLNMETVSPWEAAKEAIGPAAVMAGIFGGGAHAMNKMSRVLTEHVLQKEVPLTIEGLPFQQAMEARGRAADAIALGMNQNEEYKAIAPVWREYAEQQIKGNQPIDLDMNLDLISLKATVQENSLLKDLGMQPSDIGVKIPEAGVTENIKEGALPAPKAMPQPSPASTSEVAPTTIPITTKKPRLPTKTQLAKQAAEAAKEKVSTAVPELGTPAAPIEAPTTPVTSTVKGPKPIPSRTELKKAIPAPTPVVANVAPTEKKASLPTAKGLKAFKETQQVKVTEAAKEAATSPLNNLPEPTEAMKKAGNYPKGHLNLYGMDISIEFPKGSTRSGTSREGRKWETTMRAHYGYIKKTEGKDGDHVDTFIGEHPESQQVFIVDQVNPMTKKFDEHKTILGTTSAMQARKVYQDNYEKGWKGFGAITEMPMEQFKEWLKGDTTKPLSATVETAKKSEEVKQPWEMTRKEYIYQKRPSKYMMKFGMVPRGLKGKEATKFVDATNRNSHKAVVLAALSEGLPVPAEVLKDYPELTKAEEKPTPKVEEKPTIEAKPTEKPAWYINADDRPVHTVPSDAVGYRGPYTKQEVSELTGIDRSYLDKNKQGEPVHTPDYPKTKEEAKPHEAETKAEALPVKTGKSLLQRVQEAGRLDPKKLRAFGVDIDADIRQHKLFAVLKNGGRGLDDMATEFIGRGVIPATPENLNPGDHLLDLLKKERQGIAVTMERLDKAGDRAILELEDEHGEETVAASIREIEEGIASEVDSQTPEALAQAGQDLAQDPDFVTEEVTAETTKDLTPKELKAVETPLPPVGQTTIAGTEKAFSLASQEAAKKTFVPPEQKGERMFNVKPEFKTEKEKATEEARRLEEMKPKKEEPSFKATPTETFLPAPMSVEETETLFTDILGMIKEGSSAGMVDKLDEARPEIAKSFAQWREEGLGQSFTIEGMHRQMTVGDQVVSVIEVSARDASDIPLVAFHEVNHAVEQLMYTPSELNLVKKTVSPDEEVRSEMFAKYAVNQRYPVPKSVKPIYDRVLNIITKIRNYLRGLGFKSAQDLWDRVLSGELKARNERWEAGQPAEPGVQYNVEEEGEHGEPGRTPDHTPNIPENRNEILGERGRSEIGRIKELLERGALGSARAEDFTIRGPDTLTDAHREIVDLNKSLGNTTVFFDGVGTASEFGGFVASDEPNVLYINALRPDSMANALHEAMHTIQHQRPFAFSRLRLMVSGQTIRFNEFRDKLGEAWRRQGLRLPHTSEALSELVCELAAGRASAYVKDYPGIAAAIKETFETVKASAMLEKPSKPTFKMTPKAIEIIDQNTEKMGNPELAYMKSRTFKERLQDSLVPDESWWMRYFYNPFFKGQKIPEWKRAVDISEARRESRTEHNHEYFQIVKDFFGLQGEPLQKLQKVLIEGDATLPYLYQNLLKEAKLAQAAGNNRGAKEFRQQAKDLKALNRYSDEQLREGIKTEKGEVIALTTKEIEIYKNVRAMFDKMHGDWYATQMRIALKKYDGKSWHDALVQLYEDKLSGEAKLAKTYKALVRYGRQAYKGKEKTQETRKAEDTQALKDYLKTMNVSDAQLDAAFKEMVGAYRAQGKSMNAITRARKMLGNWIGYFPRVRGKGKYYMNVYEITTGVDKEGKEFTRKILIWNTTFQNIAEGEATEREVKKELGGRRIETELGRVTKESEQTFIGASDFNLQRILDNAIGKLRSVREVDPETMPAIRNAMVQGVSNELKARGFAQHAIRRRWRLVKGYEETGLQSVLRDYVTGFTGMTTKQEAAIDYLNLLKDVPTKAVNLYADLSKYAKDMLRNQETLDRLSGKARGFAFVWYLGANIRPMLLQITQNYVTGMPFLAQKMREWNVKGSAEMLYHRAGIEAAKTRIDKTTGEVKSKNLNKWQKKMLHEMLTKGIAEDQYVQEITGQMRGKVRKGYDRVIELLAKPFSGMEILNRKAAGLAMFDLAWKHYADIKSEEERYAKAFEEAKQYIYTTHYFYGKENLPSVATGGGPLSVLARTGLTFRSFTHNYVLSLINSKDWKTIVHSLAYVALFGGLIGLPFLKDIFDLIQKWTGYDPIKSARETMRKYGGRTLETMGMHGLPALAGANISGSMAIGLPFIGETPLDTVYGVMGGLVEKGKLATASLGRGDIYRAAENIAPEFIRGPMKALRMSEAGKELGLPGVATTQTGKALYDESGKLLRLSTGEVVTQMMGLNPTEYSAKTEATRSIVNVREYFKAERDDIYQSYRIAKTNNDTKALNTAMRSIREYNQSIRDRDVHLIVPFMKLSNVVQAAKMIPTKQQKRESFYKGEYVGTL